MSTETTEDTSGHTPVLTHEAAEEALRKTEAGLMLSDMKIAMEQLGVDHKTGGPLSKFYGILLKTMAVGTSAYVMDNLTKRFTGFSPVDAVGSHVKKFAETLKQKNADNGTPTEEGLKSSGFLGDLISALKADFGNGAGALQEQAKPVIGFLEDLAGKMGLDKSAISNIPGVDEVRQTLKSVGTALEQTQTVQTVLAAVGAGKPTVRSGPGG